MNLGLTLLVNSLFKHFYLSMLLLLALRPWQIEVFKQTAELCLVDAAVLANLVAQAQQKDGAAATKFTRCHEVGGVQSRSETKAPTILHQLKLWQTMSLAKEITDKCFKICAVQTKCVLTSFRNCVILSLTSRVLHRT